MPDHLTEIAAAFFTFDHLAGVAPVGNGNINDTYRLDFEQTGMSQTMLLQRLNHQVFRQPETLMDNMQRICHHLLQTDYPYQVLAPLKTHKGHWLHQDPEGNYWRAFPFLDHAFAPEGATDTAIAYETARSYGAFARYLQDFPAHTLAETIPGFHDTDRRWGYFLQVLSEDPVQRVSRSKTEIEALFVAKPVFDQISHLKKTGALPVRVSHNDTKAGNVLFDETTRKALAVIDLDTVMPGTLLSDFGDMVRTFVPDRPEGSLTAPSLRLDMLEALKSGFLEETSGFLNAAEQQYLMLGAKWIIGEQALRFLSDWIAGDVYYKISHPEQNLERARNQIALLEAMMNFDQ